MIIVRFLKLATKGDTERIARDIQSRGDEGTLLNVDDFGETQLSDISFDMAVSNKSEIPAQETTPLKPLSCVTSASTPASAAAAVVPTPLPEVSVDTSAASASAAPPLPQLATDAVGGVWQVTFVLTLLDLTTGDFGDEHWVLLKEVLSTHVVIQPAQVKY